MKRTFLFLVYASLVSAPGRFLAAAPESQSETSMSQTIRVEINKSVVFRVDEAVTRVAVANPQIADVTLVTPKQMLIVSKQTMGVTSLIVWQGDENAITYDVEVFIPTYLLSTIREALQTQVPGAQVTLSMTPRSLVIDGIVDNQEMLDRVLRIARSFVQEVTNLVSVRSVIQKAVTEALPEGAARNLAVELTTGGISLIGTVDSQEEMLRALQAARSFTPNVVNLIHIQGPQQVQLEVTVAEVSRSAMRQMGLNFLTMSGDGRLGLFNPGASTAETSQGTDTEGGTKANTMSDIARGLWSGKVGDTIAGAGMSSSYGSAFQLLVQAANHDRMAVISLLKGQGLARTLSSPTLVTLTGQKAEFLVGGEIPYVTREAIVFREFGIQLKFTPFVTGAETITMKVEPSVSSPDWSFDPPGLRRRSASSTLQLKDGQTFVMAGLLTEEMAKMSNKIPFLGDLPILGTLFTSKQFRKEESELVIVVTPRLVQPLNPGEVPPLPGADIDADSNDVRFFLLNDTGLSRAPKEGAEASQPERCGKAGFAK